MKIKHWDLNLTWEDGSVHEVSSYISTGLFREIEDFIDYWEEEHGEEDNDDEDEDEDEYENRSVL